MSIRASSAGVLAAAAIAASGLLGAGGAGASGSGWRSSPAEEANRAAAEADASDLLSRLQLPPGSTYSEAKPDGTNRLVAEAASESPQVRTVVDRGAWWVVPGGHRAALESIESQPPAGSELANSGWLLKNRPTEVQFAEFEWPRVPGVLFSRSLYVFAADLPDGSTVLRADAVVESVVPHPPSELIPSEARVLDLEVRRGRKVTRSITIANPRAVEKVASLIDGLPVRQPGLSKLCNFVSEFAPAKVRLTFRATPSGPPLAEAAQWTPTVCYWMQVTIGGQRQMPLEGGSLVLRGLRPFLG